MGQVKNLQELRESDPWASGANLSLEAYPWLSPHAEADADDVHLVAESRVSLGKALAKMVEEDGGDSEIARVLEAGGVENPAAPTVVHIAGQPFTIRYENNLWRGEGALNRVRHRLTAQSRDELVSKFMSLARKAKKEAIRDLTEGQLTEVARTAQRDRVQAINLYLGYAFPDNFAEENDALEIVNNPRYADFLATVTEFVWANSRLDSTDSEDWQDYKSQFIGNRPLSCALLDHAWESFSSKRNRLIFAEPPRDKQEAVPAAVESLDDLSDDEINSVYKDVARAHSQGWPGGRGFTEAEAVAVHA